MKAVLLDKEGKFSLGIVNDPLPKENEIQVKIAASGFNPIDYQMIENDMERKLLHSPILGREFSGVVTAVGSGVTDFKVGDRVFCGSGSMGSNGTYAEYITVPAEIVVHKPDHISFEQAAALPSAGLTALQCFTRMNASNTDSIFITGAAGGVGGMLIKILIAKGHRNFIVTAGNENSIDSLLALGVKKEQIINYKTTALHETALALNNNQPFSIVVDLVGGDIASTAASLIRTNGIYLDVTNFSTGDSREILFNKGATVMNISNYAYGIEKDYSYYRSGLEQLATMLRDELLTPPSINTIGDLQVATVLKAHTVLRENRTHGKKLIMQVNGLLTVSFYQENVVYSRALIRER